MTARKDTPPILLITGGGGYVGSTLIREALSKGYRVRCLDFLIYGGKPLIGLLNHPNFELIQGDIRDKEVVKRSMENVDYVIHLAAIVGDLPCQAAPRSAYQINFQGTCLLAEAAKKTGVKKFIFASTCSNYGAIDTRIAANELTTLNPVSLYAELKIDCEKFLQEFSEERFAVICLRYGTAYGVSFRTRFDLTVNSFAYEALTKNEIVVFGSNTWRPYIHVHDMAIVALLVLAAPSEKVQGQILNAGSTAQNYTKHQIIEILKKCLSGLRTRCLNNVDDNRSYRVDFSKINQTLGFVPMHTVKSGFEEIIFCFNKGILTSEDYESNKLDHLQKFFGEKESQLSKKF
ncbi:MAG: NAD-dependent epimerase/dehydratase family protein [Candidatus Scalinduaceae bacterium]